MIQTYEKIETIVNCFLSDRTMSGAMGTLTEISRGRYCVVADGLTVIVKTTAQGWRVQFKSAIGQDRDLLTAARTALEAGAKIEVSKHTDIAGDLLD